MWYQKYIGTYKNLILCFQFLGTKELAQALREKITLGYNDAGVAATWYSLFFLKFSLFIKFCFSYKYTSRSIKFVIDFLLSF